MPLPFNAQPFRKKLLAWYQTHKRDLPWRRTQNPYAIWLSEIMLQQTQVATVIPYFERFLARFPDFKSVAESPEADLLAHWAGLGYYNRIRQFQKAAKIIESDYQSNIPQNLDELLNLPGLGDYTARAVISIAFGKPEAVIDGNVMRVLSRLTAYAEEMRSGSAKVFFRQTADALLDRGEPGDFNQAMMELGATVCTPSNPACLLCPVNAMCKAYAEGNPQQYPMNSKKTVYRQEEWTGILSVNNEQILIRQRTADEIMAGMWEFPLVPVEQKPISNATPLKSVNHTIMNRRMRISPVLLRTTQKALGTWVGLTDLEKYPLTTITKKILKANPQIQKLLLA